MYRSSIKYLLRLTTFVALLAVAVGIGSCNRTKHLSDDELAMVFHDAFLANAYTLSAGIHLDSLRLYEPIFNKYGYSVEDVQQTIGNFSRRKSARLSDVVERAIKMLEEEGKRLDYEVAVLDTVNNIAKRRASKVVFEHSGFHMTNIRDTMKYKFAIPNVAAGRYRVNFDYLVDSVDVNKKSYLSQSWSEVDGDRRRYNRNTSTLSRNIVQGHTSYLQIDKNKDRIILAPVVPQANAKTVSVRVKNIKVTFLPTLDEGRDQMYEQLLNIRIFDNAMEQKNDGDGEPQDSI